MYNSCNINPASYDHLNLTDFIRYNYDSSEYKGAHVYINKKMHIRGKKELTKLINKSNGNIEKFIIQY